MDAGGEVEKTQSVINVLENQLSEEKAKLRRLVNKRFPRGFERELANEAQRRKLHLKSIKERARELESRIPIVHTKKRGSFYGLC